MANTDNKKPGNKRIIVVGDTHGRAFWKLIKEKEKWDIFIFVGDYFDTHETISPELQMINFKEIAEFALQNQGKVILLIGNHDLHYFPEIDDNGTSGYQVRAAPAIGHLLSTYRDLMKMAHAEGNILFSHAGIAESWLLLRHPDLDDNYSFNDATDIALKVNELWKNKPQTFNFSGFDPTGDDMGQTPVWIRPRSLMKDSKTIKANGIIQVVGHTQMRIIDIEGKATGAKYFFIDTLGTSREYLIYENGKFETGKI